MGCEKAGGFEASRLATHRCEYTVDANVAVIDLEAFLFRGVSGSFARETTHLCVATYAFHRTWDT